MSDNGAIAKAIIESIWKEGMLRAGLVSALAGSSYIALAGLLDLHTLGLDAPWVRTVAGFAIIIGVCGAIVAGGTSN
jgi:hypothetical protein